MASEWVTKITVFLLFLLVTSVISVNVEDMFIEEFGNDTGELVRWTIAQKEPINREILKAFCIEAQARLSRSQGSTFDVSLDVVDVDVFESVLQFRNELYKPMKVKVVEYSLDGPITPDSSRTYRYLTARDASTCVFYLTPSNTEEKRASFYLSDLVCELDPEMLFTQQSRTGPLTVPPPDIEDMFVEELGNDPVERVKWSAVQMHPDDSEFLKINCIETQKTLFENVGWSFTVGGNLVDVGVLESVLRFRKEQYKPMNVTVVKYSIDGPLRAGSEQTYRYLTGGDESSCVFYITPCESGGNDFYVEDSVCGNELFRRSAVEYRWLSVIGHDKIVKPTLKDVF